MDARAGWLGALISLSGCATDCQFHGVDVARYATPTGRIVAEYIVEPEQIAGRCMSPFRQLYGCTIPVAPNEYVIYSINDPGVLAHERCHALFETATHRN